MKLFVVISCFLVTTLNGLPIDIPEVERTFDYHGETYIFSTLGKKQVSRWDIYAKLVLQSYKDHSIIKLNDIETSMFNGLIKNQADVSKHPIPEEAKVLGNPFILLYNSSIKTSPDEPNWSLNIKRAIAGILYVDINKINEMKAYSEEKTMYGDCNVTYATFQEDKRLKLVKTIKTDECGGEIQDYYSVNHQMECPELEHDQFPREVTRTYYINDKSNPHKIDKIVAESSVIFQVTPTDVQTFHLKQIQTMELKSYVDISKKLDHSKATQIYEIKFEHGKFPMDGRAPGKELTKDELVESLLEKLESLKNQVLRPESTNHWNISTAMDNIWDIFTKQTLKSLEEVYKEIKDNDELFQIYLSYLPYVGTTDAIQMMLKLIPNENVSDEHKIRMLAIFPRYINENSQDLIEMIFEEFRALVTDNIIMNSIVMSVGQLLGNMKKNGAITQEFYDEYREDYIKKIHEADDYEDQIAFFMALKNMDSPLQTFLDLIKSEDLRPDLRIIAINCATSKFRHKTKTVRDILLPILQNESHPLDFRVAALNGLIESRMPLTKFEHVYNYLKTENGNLAHRHLYHYLYTSLASYKVDTQCKSGLATIAETYLPKMKEPTDPNSWLTGNYRIGFTDHGPDIGNTLHLRTIANPNTNAIETIEVTQDTSAMGLHRKYKLYLKIRGVLDEILKTALVGKKPKNMNDFIEILKKNSLKLHRRPLNVEIIVFSDNKAVFTTQYTKKHFNNKSYLMYVLAFAQMLMEEGILVKYPVMDYLHIPSDLGTDLTLSLDQEELIYHIRKDFDNLLDQTDGEYTLKYRHYLAISKSFSVYNPIDHVKQGGQNINVRNLYFETTFGFNLPKIEITINDQNLKFSYQSEMITELFALEEKTLQRYCPKCEQAETVYDEKQATLDKDCIEILSFIISKKSNWTSFADVLSQSINTNIGNYEVYPVSAVYFLLISHYLRDHYLPTWATNSMALSLAPESKNPVIYKLSTIADYEDLVDEKEIYPGSIAELEVKLIGHKQGDKKLLYDMGAKISLKEQPGLINQTLDLTFEMLHQNKYHKVCLDVDTLSPKASADLYSLRLANPLPINMVLNYAYSDKKGSECTENNVFKGQLEIMCSGLDEQSILMTKADHYPYKDCKEHSKGLKYTPPTKACKLAAEEMSRYRNYYFDAKVKNISMELADAIPLIDAHMIPVVNGTREKFSMEFGVASGTVKFYHLTDGKKSLKVEGWPAKYAYKYITADWLLKSEDLLSEMDDETISYGLTSTCAITNKLVDTFNKHHIKISGNKETVALIECEHAKDGVTYKVLENGKLEVKAWFEKDVVTAKPEDKIVKINVNNKELGKEEWISTEKLKVYRLADDAIIIKGPLMEIYYNTEFINILMFSIYNGRICGVCSPQENIIHS